MAKASLLAIIIFLLPLGKVLGQTEREALPNGWEVGTNLIYWTLASPNVSVAKDIGGKFAAGIAFASFGHLYVDSFMYDGDTSLGGFDHGEEPIYDINPFVRFYWQGNEHWSHFLEAFGAISNFEGEDNIERIVNSEGYGVYVRDTRRLIYGGIGIGYGYRFLFLENRFAVEA
ncbi:MAG: hypothetical protein AAGA86_10360, partial [Bacteroidota bacterium]